MRPRRAIPGARWREDKELLATVVNLTEYPSVILGNFEPEYLSAAGRSAGDRDARSSEIFRRGGRKRQAAAALSGGAEYVLAIPTA